MTALFKLLKPHGFFLTRLAAALAAVSLWLVFATKAELNATVHWAERICAAAGSEFAAKDGKPGAACVRQVAQLARFKAEAQENTSEALIAAMLAREEKQARDADRRQARLEARLAALSTMTAAEEEVRDDQVSGSWFAALNHLAGLRAPAR